MVESIKDPLQFPYDMAKELGQIHSINNAFQFPAASAPLTLGLIDIPGDLTAQLNRNIRQGCFYKIVGIDMQVTEFGGTGGGGQVSGFLRYYAPTRGRCEAYRSAFQAMRKQMDIQGVSMRDNSLYDFRVGFSSRTPISGLLRNQASLDGISPLSFTNTTIPRASVFGVHNQSVEPVNNAAPGDLFQPGFDTLLSKSPAAVDFVLNDTALYTGNENSASEDFESIPFQLSYTPGGTDISVSIEWRPDPALYLAVMAGLFEVHVDEADADSAASTLQISTNVMVSGWKSIMGDPSKKSRSRSKKNVKR